MTKILHIAMDDRRSGSGAGAVLLHEALLQRGEESELWVFFREARMPGVYVLPKTEGRPELSPQGIREMLHGRDIRTFSLVYIHGLEQNIPTGLWQVLARTRLVWRLEGCAAYTAGCSHSAHCQRWETKGGTGCADCPQFPGRSELQSRQIAIYDAKKTMYQHVKVEFLCENAWQYEQLGHSIAAGQMRQVLPSPLDRMHFTLGDKQKARAALGLSSESFVVLLAAGGAEGREAVLSMLRIALKKAAASSKGRSIVLVRIGGEKLPEDWDMVELRELDAVQPGILGEYCRAADLQLCLSGTELSYRQVREAMLCGLPSAVWDIGAARSALSEDGTIFLPALDEAALVQLMEQGVQGSDKLESLHAKLLDLHSRAVMAENLAICLGNDMDFQECDFWEIFEQSMTDIKAFVKWQAVRWAEKPEDGPKEKQDKHWQKGLFLDKFCAQWLRLLDPAELETIWDFVDSWLGSRQLSVDETFHTQEQIDAHIAICRGLREFLVKYFQLHSQAELEKLPQLKTNMIAQLWFFLFLNPKAPLYRLSMKKLECPPELLQEEKPGSGYPKYFLWTMYVPFAPENQEIGIEGLMKGSMPMALKIILVFWLISTPSYEGTREQQQAILQHIRELSEFMTREPDYISASLRTRLMEKIMVALWRLSYLGGNNIGAIQAYGDYLQSIVRRTYPTFAKPVAPRRRKKGERLRIGYISMNFRNQAVSLYMANRFRYADKSRFFVKAFYLQKGISDAMTEKIKGWSDEFESFSLDSLEEAMFRKVAKAVRDSKLDLLIYADIGMNNVTYLLGAMRLAPVQAVLVGHGTTTGLTTLDYYVSGDHEPENAQEHYTEQIVRLPDAGAAQLPPAQNDRKLERSTYGIPEDAVLFISCANGIKHVESRDHVLIEILQQAPNAYILLKPYMSPTVVDPHFRERLMAKAKAAGVAERLKIIGPLPDAGDLMALIKLADVQLDTYPYGGWTTNLEALYYHLPVVTQQGDMARSRWGARLLEVMDITEGIAHTEKEYVDWAVRFASDRELLDSVREHIAARVENALFNGEKAQPAYEEALVRMIEAKEKKMKRKGKH